MALMSSMVTFEQAAADDWSILGAVVGAKALHWHTLAHYFDMSACYMFVCLVKPVCAVLCPSSVCSSALR